MDKMTKEVRLEYWANIIQSCNSSGKKKKQWCAENNIDEKQYYYWQRRIRTLIYDERKTSTSMSAPVFAEVPVVCSESSMELSVKRNDIEENHCPTLRLNKGGIAIEIMNLSESGLLRFTKELLYNA